MNIVQLFTTFTQHGKPGRIPIYQHLVVFLLTLAVAVWRLFVEHGPISLILPEHSTKVTTTLQPPTDATASGVPAVHSNVKVAVVLLMWVSFLAVAFRLIARTVTYACREPSESKASGPRENKASIS